MRTSRINPFTTALGLIAVYWLSTFVILGDAPLLAGPQDEADRALAFFARRTAIALSLLIAVLITRRLSRRWITVKPDGAGDTPD